MESTCELPLLPSSFGSQDYRALHSTFGDKYCHGQKTIGKTRKHYGVSNETGHKWYFNQHACFNIWSMVFLSTIEYSTTLVLYLIYHLL
jgi:hypothetical protein